MQPKKIPIFDFAETLKRNRQSLLGALCTLCFHPHRPGIPHSVIIIGRLMKNSTKEGVKGCPPWAAYPLWGREGVSLLVPIRE
jgi:hypothetical protein